MCKQTVLTMVVLQLVNISVISLHPASSSTPSCGGGVCINLCCPTDQAYTQAGVSQGGRCEAEHKVERSCQPYQELPGWSPEWRSGLSGKFGLMGSEGERFVCQKGSQLLSAENLFGPQDFRLSASGELNIELQGFNNNLTEHITFMPSDFCLMFTDIPDYYDYAEDGSGEENVTEEGDNIRALYSVCHKEEEENGREFTGIFYPAAIFISNFFVFITICVYLFVGNMRKNIFGKITIGFLLNVFICYTFLGVHYSLDLFSHKEILDTIFCKFLGYVIQHTFIGFFFWMSAMAFNITHTFTNPFSLKKSNNQFKSLLLNICYAQGCPLIITCVTAIMDFYGPCDSILPNMGKFTCFLGSEYNPETPFFMTPEFLYFYLIIATIMVSNIICFIITGTALISHWWQMRDLDSRVQNSDLKAQFGIVFKIFIIMGIPWTCDIISAAVGHAYGSGKSFEIRLLLDVLNLLTGVLIFLALVCKQQVMKSIKTRLTSSNSVKTVLSTKSSSSSTVRHHSTASSGLGSQNSNGV
eukprot:GFUD01006633.1.p1 GENE.GFUD01006633.1~~GFUD01006633.1.p1  ORF type:complete len:527 (+),score=97.66 GFUD01006633.1:364-1944(+)